MPLGKLFSKGDRVTSVRGAGGGDSGRLVTCRRIDPASQYVNNRTRAFQCQRKRFGEGKGEKERRLMGLSQKWKSPTSLASTAYEDRDSNECCVSVYTHIHTCIHIYIYPHTCIHMFTHVTHTYT